MPENESERLAELHRYGILDTPPEESFDRLARQAAALFDAPISLITFVDANRQFFKSHYGLEINETPRDQAFCAHAIHHGSATIVCDAKADARFADNPLVLEGPKIRFYVGAPLETAGGFRLGTLCVIDKKEQRYPDQRKIDALEDLAKHAVELLELRRTQHELAKSRELWSKTEQRATLALEAGKMGYWERDAETDLIRFSPALEKMLELNHEEYDGSIEGWLAHIHPDDHNTILSGIAEANHTHQNYTFKYRVRTADGSERWITTTGTYRVDEAGRFAGAQGVSWDSTASDRAERELRLSEALFRGVSESAPIGVFRADTNRELIYVNARMAEIYGMTEEEVMGVGWAKRIHPDDRDEIAAFIASFDPADKYWEREFRLLLPGDTVRWILVRSSVLHDESGQHIGETGTVDDVTERKQTIGYLKEAKESAESANRAKDLFLANVSHELRTPLNGVLGISDQLLDSGLTAEQLEMAKLVRDSGRELLKVVNDLLDLNRIESGKLAIERSSFDLRRSIQQMSALFEAEAIKKGLRLKTYYPDDLPVFYQGDASRIKQILANYLSNAIKFSADGEVEIKVHGEPGDGKVDLLLAVRDHGPGIELEAQSRLFRSFSQIDDSSTRRNGGLGLGLAICKRLAELMGGSVGVSSSVGEGSTFWVRLELAYGSEPERTTKQMARKSSAGSGRVLLVEDNPINQKVALGVLSRLGWQADVAGTGVAAIDLFRKNHYAVVFMDCQMPEMDGYAATEQIRRWEEMHGRAQVPIVALTAHAMTGDRERCLEAGMNDYLAKPFGLEELREALSRWTR